MKKPLLLLLFLTLLPILIWAQGFGGFASDQPFFAKDIASPEQIVTPTVGTELWFVHTDLTNDTRADTWTDRIQGKVLTQIAAGHITNRANGLHWTGTGTRQTLTNLAGGSFVANANTNLAVGLIVNWTKPNSTAPMFGESFAKGMLVFYSGGTFLFDNWISGNVQRTWGTINTNVFIDLLVVNTNGTTGSYPVTYTNGVFAGVAADFSSNPNVPRLGVIGDWWSGALYANMIVKEMISITNVSAGSISNVAYQWHYYRTNTYGP